MFFMFNLVCFLQMVKFTLAFRAARVRVDPVAEIVDVRLIHVLMTKDLSPAALSKKRINNLGKPSASVDLSATCRPTQQRK